MRTASRTAKRSSFSGTLCFHVSSLSLCFWPCSLIRASYSALLHPGCFGGASHLPTIELIVITRELERSEERRVGKEWRGRGSPGEDRQKENNRQCRESRKGAR